ncbi:DUF2163 domain-containing protein [Lutimaribacter sp. EGI FJ00015]|uniref:DUF2163 domain-containing protein n=1 Tax=Lutimaribacter degradans TaxID=2945989 RepID=A0ACC5ZRV8_9RHOB|nr:DUF2163 domain-containing protein [Lutimaribacter sp. EGI FJ00013]MCM2561041.1 DUF2163 domain-containing protein [Lutimaribacter sp. EGI FJ00013]MCO0612012.1 DUF2163 domain-containing protein [Lutimaribacter sp. EGI FJ00015]MCO0634868.1 DUF2163 domain-containing protein [Lutimaribacter sp. EGI FJ00014]
MDGAFQSHIERGLTTLANAWAIRRGDGLILGFTDHDRDLEFEGIVFRADSGLTAAALQQTTGLSVDNTEALGALSDAGISAADIDAGRFDGAELRIWIVNWADVSQRHVRFRGSLGEIKRGGGAFQAELRGLTEVLNRPVGRVYQKPCSAVLGDGACGFDLSTPGYVTETEIRDISEDGAMVCPRLPGFAPDWFRRGRFEILDGDAIGLHGQIKRDAPGAESRLIVPWVALRAELRPGDRVRLVAGCDKRFDTCRFKFNNVLNFQGFPDLPNEDWLAALPARSGNLGGGSLR